MRPGCECWDRDLPVDSTDAWICSLECTWCGDCARAVLRMACPNCDGDLTRRPVRPASAVAANPPSTVRVHDPGRTWRG
ncbi:DUF1272 domain-containing protein [Nocardioides dongxiaopingii]|uniref:DUF1272 domain-containing protein n=1 Tax=Nocardioides dongxiaopingii TaxID=2576036 RepID=UPI001BB06964|nr:DUF1272 domain-containing protein [Nocardioides dongxiaopingii]